MKHIIATLLIALAISVSAQERTSALKDLSNVDPATGRTALDVYSKAESDALTPSIDNSAINEAIAEDPAASRTAMGAIGEGDDLNVGELSTDSLSLNGFPIRSLLEQRIWAPQPSSSWSLNQGTVAVSAFPTHFKMLTSAATDSTNVVASTVTSEAFPMMQFVETAGSNGGNIDFSKEVWASFKFSIVTATATSILKGWCGVLPSLVADPTSRGIGFEVRNLSLYSVVYGASLSKSASAIATLVADKNNVLILNKKTSGDVDYYLNGVLIHTATGGPTSSVAGTGFHFSQTTGATATAVRTLMGSPVVYVAP